MPIEYASPRSSRTSPVEAARRTVAERVVAARPGRPSGRGRRAAVPTPAVRDVDLLGVALDMVRACGGRRRGPRRSGRVGRGGGEPLRPPDRHERVVVDRAGGGHDEFGRAGTSGRGCRRARRASSPRASRRDRAPPTRARGGTNTDSSSSEAASSSGVSITIASSSRMTSRSASTSSAIEGRARAPARRGGRWPWPRRMAGTRAKNAVELLRGEGVELAADRVDGDVDLVAPAGAACP